VRFLSSEVDAGLIPRLLGFAVFIQVHCVKRIKAHVIWRIEFHTRFNGDGQSTKPLISPIASSIDYVRGYLAEIDQTDDDASGNNHGIHWIQDNFEISTQSIPAIALQSGEFSMHADPPTRKTRQV
jgi:hypothetical protein